MKKLELGTVAMTQGIANTIHNTPEGVGFLVGILSRHANGDWGDVDFHDKRANDHAAANGYRVLSVYKTPDDADFHTDTVWIITEHDRSITTILLPSEY